MSDLEEGIDNLQLLSEMDRTKGLNPFFTYHMEKAIESVIFLAVINN